MELRGNAKVTNDRVFSMVVHPDKRKDLVFVGDKYGSLGMYVFFYRSLGSGADLVDGTHLDRQRRRSKMRMILLE